MSKPSRKLKRTLEQSAGLYHKTSQSPVDNANERLILSKTATLSFGSSSFANSPKGSNNLRLIKRNTKKTGSFGHSLSLKGRNSPSRTPKRHLNPGRSRNRSTSGTISPRPTSSRGKKTIGANGLSGTTSTTVNKYYKFESLNGNSVSAKSLSITTDSHLKSTNINGWAESTPKRGGKIKPPLLPGVGKEKAQLSLASIANGVRLKKSRASKTKMTEEEAELTKASSAKLLGQTKNMISTASMRRSGHTSPVHSNFSVSISHSFSNNHTIAGSPKPTNTKTSGTSHEAKQHGESARPRPSPEQIRKLELRLMNSLSSSRTDRSKQGPLEGTLCDVASLFPELKELSMLLRKGYHSMTSALESELKAALDNTKLQDQIDLLERNNTALKAERETLCSENLILKKENRDLEARSQSQLNQINDLKKEARANMKAKLLGTDGQGESLSPKAQQRLMDEVKYLVDENKALSHLMEKLQMEYEQCRFRENRAIKLLKVMKERGHPVEEVYESERKKEEELLRKEYEGADNEGHVTSFEFDASYEDITSGPYPTKDKPNLIPALDLEKVTLESSSDEYDSEGKDDYHGPNHHNFINIKNNQVAHPLQNGNHNITQSSNQEQNLTSLSASRIQKDSKLENSSSTLGGKMSIFNDKEGKEEEAKSEIKPFVVDAGGDADIEDSLVHQEELSVEEGHHPLVEDHSKNGATEVTKANKPKFQLSLGQVQERQAPNFHEEFMGRYEDFSPSWREAARNGRSA